MKIRGRFIGILAVLGLFMALVPLYTAGAVTGEVTLTGGEKGQFYSDRCVSTTECFNIMTIDVEDADLSPLRYGKGRAGQATSISTGANPGTVAASSNYLSLGNLVIEGEKGEVQEFDGGTSNGPCDEPAGEDIDGNGTNGEEGVINADCPDEGDAVVDVGDDGFADDLTTTDDDESENNTYTFALDKTARDANADGVVDYKDFTVRVNNSLLKDQASPSESGYFVVVADTGTDGHGVSEVVIHGKVPTDRDDSVVITYEYSEYVFASPDGSPAVPITTPLNIAGSRVFHGDDRENVDEMGVDGVDSSENRLRIAAPDLSDSDSAVVTFAYHVGEKPKKLVTVSSGTSQGARDVTLDGEETGVRSSVFRSSVALVSLSEYNLIDEASDDPLLNKDTEKKKRADGSVEVNVTQLLTSDSLDAARVQLIVGELDITGTADSKKLVARLLPVSHGDTVTVAYADKDVRGNSTGSMVKTAEVDLEAPVVTLVRPSDKLYTKESTVTLQADVVDADAGVNQEDIEIVATSAVNVPPKSEQLKAPITSGFSVTAVPTTGIAEGPQSWAVLVRDKVGNTPVVDVVDADECLPGSTGDDCDKGAGPLGVNEGARGAAAPLEAIIDVDNAFTFTIDTSGPTLQSGKTGVALKYPGVKTGENKEIEDPVNKRDWLRVNFDLGTGGAPLDASTVSASDFQVDGLEPLDAKVNVRKLGDAVAGSAVYLQVGELDTSARPKVELTGEIRDRSGNVRTGGSVSSIADGLSPVLSVTTSADISSSKVTVTVSSSERLSGRPMVNLTETMPDSGTTEGLGSPLPVTLQVGEVTVWETDENVAPGQSFKYYVVVSGKDSSGNGAVVGDDKPDKDVISFQLDAENPRLKFVDANGDELKSTKQEEGAVWIVAEFDEDEHAGDDYRKVEVTSVTLKNKDTDEVITEDVSQVFGSEEDCVDHEVTEDVALDGVGDKKASKEQTDKCAERTLAVNLTPGMYNIAFTGVDQTGNARSANTDFEVIPAKPFELTLRPGQNFISIPGMPMGDGGNIDTLLADEAISSISTYDRSRQLQGENPWLRAAKDLETGMFSGDITAIEPGKAYFINSTASVTLEIRLQSAGDLPPTIPVRQGYNSIGFWSVAGDYDPDTNVGPEFDQYLGSIGWSVAYSYDPTPGAGWAVIRKGQIDQDTDEGLKIEAGKGYLVYALYDSVLTP